MGFVLLGARRLTLPRFLNPDLSSQPWFEKLQMHIHFWGVVPEHVKAKMMWAENLLM